MCLSRPKPLERDKTVIDLAAVRRQRDQVLLDNLPPAERELVEPVMRDHPGISAAEAFAIWSTADCEISVVLTVEVAKEKKFQVRASGLSVREDKGAYHAKAKASLKVRKFHLSELHCALSYG